MEKVLQEINKKFISLEDEEIRKNNQILQSVLSLLIEKMKTIDPLFKVLYRRVFYGGSYYDGLRVGKPDEFDLDLLLHIPRYAQPALINTNISGFVGLKVRNFDGLMKHPKALPTYQNFGKLFDENFFLDTEKTLAWMESIVQKSLNGFHIKGLDIKFSKGGPAVTLHIAGSGIKMDVDLVTCFVCSGDKWPTQRCNPFPGSKPEFFIVPKKPKVPSSQLSRYWRLSFQEQERAIMENKQTLKQTVKLIKKMRDTLQHDCIASYYIKTVLLHLTDNSLSTFWRQPLSEVFMTALKEYRNFIKNGKIPYFWDPKNNLIGDVKSETLENISGELSHIISRIESSPDMPEVIATYLLTKDEYNSLGVF